MFGWPWAELTKSHFAKVCARRGALESFHFDRESVLVESIWPRARPLETPLELGDPNWTGGGLEGDLPCSCGSGEEGGGDGERSGGKSELGMAKKMDSVVHCRFTTLNPSWYYSKWRSPSSAVPTTVAGGRRPLERV